VANARHGGGGGVCCERKRWWGWLAGGRGPRPAGELAFEALAVAASACVANGSVVELMKIEVEE